MGRPRKPPKLRLIEGNPGHRPIPEEAPVPLTDLFELGPEFGGLGEFGRAKARWAWELLVPLMTSGFFLADSDYLLLEAFCATYGRWHEAASGGDVQGERRARVDLLAYSAKLGLNPVDRLRLHIPTREPQTSSVLD